MQFRRLLAAGALILGVLASACGRSETAPRPDAIYTVRGRIEQLPEAGAARPTIQIFHEPIPSFVRPDGKLGMNAMSMPFPVAEGVSLEGFAVGDVVEFTWEHRKSGSPRYQMTAITRLPPETPLDFENRGS